MVLGVRLMREMFRWPSYRVRSSFSAPRPPDNYQTAFKTSSQEAKDAAKAAGLNYRKGYPPDLYLPADSMPTTPGNLARPPSGPPSASSKSTARPLTLATDVSFDQRPSVSFQSDPAGRKTMATPAAGPSKKIHAIVQPTTTRNDLELKRQRMIFGPPGKRHSPVLALRAQHLRRESSPEGSNASPQACTVTAKSAPRPSPKNGRPADPLSVATNAAQESTTTGIPAVEPGQKDTRRTIPAIATESTTEASPQLGPFQNTQGGGEAPPIPERNRLQKDPHRCVSPSVANAAQEFTITAIPPSSEAATSMGLPPQAARENGPSKASAPACSIPPKQSAATKLTPILRTVESSSKRLVSKDGRLVSDPISRRVELSSVRLVNKDNGRPLTERFTESIPTRITRKSPPHRADMARRAAEIAMSKQTYT